MSGTMIFRPVKGHCVRESSSDIGCGFSTGQASPERYGCSRVLLLIGFG
jgi:hypothetical protein